MLRVGLRRMNGLPNPFRRSPAEAVRSLTPSGRKASRTAPAMAAGAPIGPASPQPLAPSGIVGAGLAFVEARRLTGGMSAARGSA